MVGKLDDYLRFNEMALSLRGQRQQVLASNIANADTPNYKARDIDFASAMQNALAGSQGGLATTNAGHLQTGAKPGDTLPDGTPLLYRTPAQGAADGNTVDMDVERNQFADNAVRYEAGITMINMQIKGILAAIQGGS
ncbi:flagellar basal body rod protein FlgB [Massilia arenosa]|uniref:Flagellar basal body rod protein FlgB n=1 Tax=Zemynaea arenosa TaxID=2561931 RepID=A0A4Y9SWL5_9BURK|nr:flagellar basal body rod protein FlgB [Massilia arenosa]TFW29917.1 flagellar basal body rod protein FlgB [Massilia arenosa]